MPQAFDGDIAGALRQLDAFRVLCAHRSGPFGVDGWNVRAERLLERAEVQTRGHYPGQPIMVTANDPTRRLFNGDVGVVVRDDRGLRVAFPNSDLPPIDPVSLSEHTTVHAMTIHKSQGSEFDHVVVVLPPEGSRLATRELLYTAVTRARRRVTLVGSRASVLTALPLRTTRKWSSSPPRDGAGARLIFLISMLAKISAQGRSPLKMTAVWVNVEGRAVVRQQDPVALRLSLQQCASPERTGTVPYRHW